MRVASYLDRINVSNARLAGMQKDLGMSDTEWSAGISLFYVGYILSQASEIPSSATHLCFCSADIVLLLQVPGNVILAKGNPRLLLPLCMLGWSVTTICMTFLTSGPGFMVCRFVVGVTEGPFVPGISLMTSSWYTKHESPLRMSIWHAGNIISNVISGLLAAAILTTMEGIRGLHAWQVSRPQNPVYQFFCLILTMLLPTIVVRPHRGHRQYRSRSLLILVYPKVA